jgi:hypothetical protein
LVTVDRTTTGDTDAEVAEEPAGRAAVKSEREENSLPEKSRP